MASLNYTTNFLLCNNVQYVIPNDAEQESINSEVQPIIQEPYSDFINTQLGSLDPNLSSVARYSPVLPDQYQDNLNNEFDQINIPQYVDQCTAENPAQANFENISAENLNNFASQIANEICPESLQDNNFINNLTQKIDSSVGDVEEKQLPPDDLEVQFVILDQDTGLTYTVDAKEFLVQPCLEDNQAPSNDLRQQTIADSSFLDEGVDDPASEDIITPEALNSMVLDEELLNTYIHFIDKEDYAAQNRVHTRSTALNNISEEDGLLSHVFYIMDKPILSHARASLPESYLSINNVDEEDSVVAKKRISKRTQFGPLKGALREFNKDDSKSNRFFLEREGVIYNVDISDENNTNWMAFVRKAETFEEQNMIVSQDGNGLYFTATRNILPKEELKVGYGENYAKRFNLEILRTEKKTWPCYECTNKFLTSQQLHKHLDAHDQERGDKINPEKKSKKRIKKSISNLVECRTCSAIFAHNISQKNLNSHMVEKHDCVGGSLEEHFTVHTCHRCKECNMQFKQEILLKIHQLQHDADLPLELPNHVCPECQKKYPTRKQLALHVNCHALSKSIIKDQSKCEVCNKLFIHTTSLQKHMLVHKSDDENKPMQCKECSKRFKTESALMVHVKVHEKSGKKFRCPICKEWFDRVAIFRNHISTHCIDGKFTCPVCDKQYKQYSILRKHMKFHNEKTFKCNECSKAFATKDALNKHMLKHSDLKLFLCHDCGKQFKRKDKLLDHINNRHGSNEKKFLISLFNKSKLRKTMAFDRYFYKCDTCLIGFKRRGMLVNHLAKRHPDINPDTVAELNVPVLETAKEYLCQYCDRVYRNKSKRKCHVLKWHPGAPLPVDSGQKAIADGNDDCSQISAIIKKPQYCKWCHRQYLTKSKLIQHIRKHHPTECSKMDIQKKKVTKTAATTISNAIVNNAVDNRMTVPCELPSREVEVENLMLHQNDGFTEVLCRDQITTDGNIATITSTRMDALITEDPQFCRLTTIDENDIIDGDRMVNHNAHLYHLLTTTNSEIIPHC